MIRNWTATFLLFALCATAHPQTITIHDRGVRNVDNSIADQRGVEFTIRGLSGITWAGGDEFLAVMDNSNKIVRFAVTFNEDASIDSIKCKGGISLADSRDFEGIAMFPGSKDLVLLSEEDTPAVHEYRVFDGTRVRNLPTPKVFLRPNLRSNFGFESLAARDDAIWTANEEALSCDGDRSDQKSGCAVRLLKYTIRDGKISLGPQFVYITDPIHKPYSDTDRGTSRSGVSDLLLLPDGRLLALERSFSRLGPIDSLSDFRNSIYEIDFDGATDVSTDEYSKGLVGKRFNPVRKKLVWSHRGNEIGNLEGIALGRQIGPNRWAAVGVSDNNGIKLFTNRVTAFEVQVNSPSPRPSP